MENIDRTLLTFVGVALGIVLAVAAILIAMYVVVENSEAEIRAEMQRVEADLKAEMRSFKVEMRSLDAERKAESQRLEAERKAENQRLDAERKAEMAALIAQFDRFIERVDSRLDEVEQEQARLNAVNDLLAEQAGR